MIVLHRWQVFEEISASKKASILNVARLYMQGLRRIPNMSGYLWLQMPQ